MTRDTLIRIMSKMDIPDGRRDITQPQNVSWLMRNLGIRNDPAVSRLVLKELVKLRKEGRA